MAPPTIMLATHSLVVCLIAIVAAPWLVRVAQRVRVWRYSVTINAMAMTFYLWHLPMLIALFVLEHVVGLEVPVRVTTNGVLVPGTQYWFWWMLHVTLFIAMVAGIVRCTWIFENTNFPLWDRSLRPRSISKGFGYLLIGAGVTISGAGLLVFSATGLGGFPTRIVHYAGLPLTSGLALVLLIRGAFAIRLGGSGQS